MFLWLHRWLGIASSIVVFIVALSGCIYVFEEEGRDIFQRKYFYADVPDRAVRQPLDSLSATIRTQYPADTISQVRFKTAADATVIYHTVTGKAISVNPYTKAVIGVRNSDDDFFNWIEELHVNLHLGKVGNEIVRWNVLIFFILCVTGLIVWWPKQKRLLKRALRINWKTENKKRFTWDLHSVLGFYALLVLLVVSLTGMFWMFDWVKQFTAFVTGNRIVQAKAPVNKSKAGPETITMESAYEKAAALYPGASQVFINRPANPKQPIRVLMRYPYTIVRKQNTLFFDRYSGELLREDLYKNNNGYDKVARSNFDFHTGRIHALGIGSKIVYFLASLFAASLPVTGIMIWLGRGKKKKKAEKENRKTVLAGYFSRKQRARNARLENDAATTLHN